VDIVQCVVYSSEQFRTAYARVTALEDDAKLLDNRELWPDTVSHTVRPWRFGTDGGVGNFSNGSQ